MQGCLKGALRNSLLRSFPGEEVGNRPLWSLSPYAQGQQHSAVWDKGMRIPREDSLRCSVCATHGATSALRFPIAYSSPNAKATEGNRNQIRNQVTHSGLESEGEEFIFPSSKQRKLYWLPIPFSPRYPGLLRVRECETLWVIVYHF